MNLTCGDQTLCKIMETISCSIACTRQKEAIVSSMTSSLREKSVLSRSPG